MVGPLERVVIAMGVRMVEGGQAIGPACAHPWSSFLALSRDVRSNTALGYVHFSCNSHNSVGQASHPPSDFPGPP